MFIWKAIYSDGLFLDQYDITGKEVLYKDIDFTKLIAFEIHEGNERQIIVDLRAGVFYINGLLFEIPDYSNKEGREYRLIYFRRNVVNICQGGGEESRKVEPFIGYQFTENEVNKQVKISCTDNCFRIHVK